MPIDTKNRPSPSPAPATSSPSAAAPAGAAAAPPTDEGTDVDDIAMLAKVNNGIAWFTEHVSPQGMIATTAHDAFVLSRGARAVVADVTGLDSNAPLTKLAPGERRVMGFDAHVSPTGEGLVATAKARLQSTRNEDGSYDVQADTEFGAGVKGEIGEVEGEITGHAALHVEFDAATPAEADERAEDSKQLASSFTKNLISGTAATAGVVHGDDAKLLERAKLVKVSLGVDTEGLVSLGENPALSAELKLEGAAGASVAVKNENGKKTAIVEVRYGGAGEAELAVGGGGEANKLQVGALKVGVDATVIRREAFELPDDFPMSLAGNPQAVMMAVRGAGEVSYAVEAADDFGPVHVQGEIEVEGGLAEAQKVASALVHGTDTDVPVHGEIKTFIGNDPTLKAKAGPFARGSVESYKLRLDSEREINSLEDLRNLPKPAARKEPDVSSLRVVGR